jgi:hypothetical protein
MLPITLEALPRALVPKKIERNREKPDASAGSTWRLSRASGRLILKTAVGLPAVMKSQR